MKTTIDIADSLFGETKRLALKKGKTFKEILESALRTFLEQNKKTSTPFKLKKHAFMGNGMCSDINESDWSSIRNKIYEGRGE